MSARPVIRLITRATLCLTVGLCANVAVAWALAAWLPHSNWNAEVVSQKGGPNNRFALFMTHYYTHGASRHGWCREYYGTTRMPPFFQGIEDARRHYRNDDNSQLRGLAWGRAEAVRERPEAFAQDGCEHATGWPLLTAWCEWTFTFTATPQLGLDGGIPITNTTPNLFLMSASELRALPLRPIWTGLAINTDLTQSPLTDFHPTLRASNASGLR